MKTKNNMIGIYKFYIDCGRQGFLDGIFTADAKDVEKAIGEEIRFGDVLGKYSDIRFVLEDKDIELVTNDEALIYAFEEYDMETGHNPINQYLNDLEDDLYDEE